jgi:hypothetical protein
MGYVGNRAGPRKPGIVCKLSPGYFGISPEELASEIDLYLADEFQGEADPVYVDRRGRHFVAFTAPGGATQRSYVEESGCRLSGPIHEIAMEDAE